MPPEEGLALFSELEKARECFVLETELHIIYLVTPYNICSQWGNLDWMLFLDLWEKLSSSMKRVGDLVGVRESYIINGTRNKLQTNTTKLYQKLLVHKRFFTALALQDLVNEVPLNDVAVKFGCARGMLQSLQQSASTFAGMLTIFCRQLGWSTIEILVSQFQDRLQFGINRDLLDLMRLPALNGQRARALFNGGLETVAQLASSDYNVVENLLSKVIPFESDKERNGESEYDALKRNKIKGVWITGKEGLTETEAAIMLVEDARKYLQLELGLTDAKWGEAQSTLDDSIKSIKDVSVANITSRSIITSDQSLFEESFELNKQLANCAITNGIETIPPKHSPVKTRSNNDSGLEFDNASLLEEAFVQTFDLQDNSNELICASQCEVSSVIDSFDPTCNRSKKRGHSLNINVETPTKRCKVQNLVDLTRINIINVCDNLKLFETFSFEVSEQLCIGLSFACIKSTENTPVIGNNIIKKNITQKQFCCKSKQVVGIAVTWGGNVAYYLSFEDESVIKNCTKINLVQKLFANRKLCMRLFDCKEHLKTAKLCCDIDFNICVEDSKVADWLLDPEGKEKNLQAMASKYAPEAVGISQMSGDYKGVGSVGLHLHSTVEPHLRAAAEVIVSWCVCESITNVLIEQTATLLETYRTEMSTMVSLAKMEIHGIGVSNVELQALVSKLKEQATMLENRCFGLVGHRFSLTSSNDVAKALGIYKGRKISTRKQVLEQIDKPLASLVVQWRKLNNTLTKMIYPLIRSMENDRIYGCTITHSATGRISMHEPNIQNIPRDFQIEGVEQFSICCRDVFVSTSNTVFLSADYCQLELRLLAHFSQDELLCAVMKSGEDVFKSVAAKWKNIPEVKVDQVLRQRAKQLCYGIIYGIGLKALAEQLEVTTDEASNFIDSFHSRYPKIRMFIDNTINKCRNFGYVETLGSRRRYLPHITDTNNTTSSQAERQAVNTTIQGSAADIAKTATVLIDARYQEKFRRRENLPKLVLHLHDEFLYEVQDKYLVKTAKILKKTMEEAVKLSVPFPVKIKSGKSWGKMTELVV